MGAARLFCRALEEGGMSSDRISAHKVINELYAARGEQFGSSSPEVRASVRRRYREEREIALGMLGGNARSGRATV
jgi:hypothetical protein